MATNMKESGFEAEVVESMVGQGGFVPGVSTDFDPAHAVDLDKLFAFLSATQPDTVAQMGIGSEGTSRDKFLFRLSKQVERRGVVDVLLKGVKDGPHSVSLFYGTPSALNARASALHDANVFSVTRQVRYSTDQTAHSIDLVAFVNGLPLATFELKNNLTGQTYDDAIRQYKDTRDPREPLCSPGRCAVHVALDEQQAYFCGELRGKSSWFLPFNKGRDGGAGNPHNPDGYRTSYVWEEVFTRSSLVDIIENYARKVTETDPRSRVKRTKYIWPRFHQLEVTRRLLADARESGAGGRYLIQHSAGSGKSYSITWLTHQLINLRGGDGEPVFDTVVVITDRRALDAQLGDEIRRFTQVRSVLGRVTQGSSQLREFLEQGKRIITSTIQKFPFVLDALGDAHRDRTFAVVIDEAHSSQGGKSAAAVNRALEAHERQEGEDAEDQLLRVMEGRKMLGNASYFAFTATPKNRTEELFGTRQPDGSFAPFHAYTMKQAIEEGFIMDVLAHYTTVESYYRLVKTVEEDPEFDVKKAQQKLRRYVESHDKPMRAKAEVMLDHLVDEVLRPRLVGGAARAMLVTDGVQRVLDYHGIFRELIAARGLDIDVIAGFSGERDWGGKKVTEASINGFPSAEIPEKLRQDPYRLLIVADKFQTGFDEPLLQTMYVDKALSDVKAVQTLSRLNRAHPGKSKVFVMDFANDAETIRASFAKYYRATILSEGTDVNKLHDLKADLDAAQVYSDDKVDAIVDAFLAGHDRATFEGILDGCVEVYVEDLDEDGQVEFKGKAKAFVRLYDFMSALIDFNDASWERLSITLNFLIPRLPSPRSEDMSRGLLETIDLDSYRNEIQARQAIALEDADGVLDPAPAAAAASTRQLELGFLSEILSTFNDLFGGGAFEMKDEEHVRNVLLNDLPRRVAEDPSVQNAIRQGDRQKVEMEQRRATQEAILEIVFERADRTDDMSRFLRAFSDSPQHQRYILETVRQIIQGNAYQVAVMAHPGWDDAISWLEDPRRVTLALGLRDHGVPAPTGVVNDIPGSESHAAFVWAFTDGRPTIGLVDEEVTGDPHGITLVKIEPDADPAALAPQLITLLDEHPPATT